MGKPRIQVDFNEMPEQDEVLLSKSDVVVDSLGNQVPLTEGIELIGYCEDQDKDGNPDNLFAEGTAWLNRHEGWTSAARWLLKISGQGVRHESEAPGQALRDA